ncbi:MAG: phosphatidylglycerophosphatase A [Bdellovibrionota bacterium]
MKKLMNKTWDQWVVTFGGVGYMKPAPGTWGTLAALPFVWALSHAGIIVYMAVTIAVIGLGIFASQVYENSREGHDFSEIVIDEVAGILITMTWLPMTWQSLIFGFFLFRFLDIWKPFPIRYLDRNVQGGVGVVIDDVAAGLVANIVLQVIYTKTMWLGVQGITIQ